MSSETKRPVAKSGNADSPQISASLPSVAATQIVEQRGGVYGPPTPIYLDWAEFMNTWLRIDGVTDPEGIIRALVPTDGAISNIFLKLARMKHGSPHSDNLNDICGYANVYHMIEEDLPWT